MIRKKQNNVVWGLDFGGSALRLVRLTRSGADYHADKFLEVPLDDRWEKPTEPAAALARMAPQKLTDPLVVCGADERILFRTLSLPDAPPNALAKMIHSQLEVLIPTQAEHFATGYSNYPDPSDTSRQRVLLSAVRREVLSTILQSCRHLGRQADGLVPSIFALAATWAHLDGNSQTPLLLLDIGARSTGLALLDGPKVAHCTIIDQAGDHWTERIAEKLNITYAQAEKRKLSYAASPSPAHDDSAVHHCLSPLLDDWSRQLRDAYRNCLADATLHKPLTRCIVFGRSAHMPGLSELIAATLDLQVVQPDLPTHLSLAQDTDFPQSAPAISAAFSAMQDDWPSLNFAATAERIARTSKVLSWRWAALLGWLLAALFSLYARDMLKASGLQNTREEVRTKIDKQAGLDQQLAIGNYLAGPTPLDVLDSISSVLPEKTLLTGWTYSRNGDVTISGTVPKQKDFEPMCRKLSQLGQLDYKSARPDKKKFRFQIALTLDRLFTIPTSPPTTQTDKEKPKTPEEKTPEPTEKPSTNDQPSKEPDAKEPDTKVSEPDATTSEPAEKTPPPSLKEEKEEEK